MAVVELDRVSKAYRLGGPSNLREVITSRMRRLLGEGWADETERRFLALDDVSFSVERGAAVGIVGHNGAGKSTILKLLSRVAFPTSGRVTVRGQTAALIELGAGFHPDLTGRENVYLAGSMLGMRRREIAAQFGAIVEFAGLEQFIETPVKRYSSGMYVRLAFAVAAHVRAEVLLIDEVLAVGDAAFQQRCLAKMGELHRSGVTILLVSHNLWLVEGFCERALLLRRGRLECHGSTSAVLDRYREYERVDMLQSAEAAREPAGPAGAPSFLRLELYDCDGQALGEAPMGASIAVRLTYAAPEPLRSPVFLVRIRRADGLICCAVSSRAAQDSIPGLLLGEGVVEALVGPLPLVPDVYTVEALLIDRVQPIIYAASRRASLRVAGPLSGMNDAGVFAPGVEWRAWHV